ncbi:hypothetical protein FQA39_LY02729 [Lamprigera yunnana]|nr:hypothetical protein FQA39_LY02729 [Lamprigera yunnana]
MAMNAKSAEMISANTKFKEKNSVLSAIDHSETRKNNSNVSLLTSICPETTPQRSDRSDFLIPIVEKIVFPKDRETVNYSYTFSYSEIDSNVFDQSSLDPAPISGVFNSTPIELETFFDVILLESTEPSPIIEGYTRPTRSFEVRCINQIEPIRSIVPGNRETEFVNLQSGDVESTHLPDIYNSTPVEFKSALDEKSPQNVGALLHYQIHINPAPIKVQHNVDRTISRFGQFLQVSEMC